MRRRRFHVRRAGLVASAIAGTLAFGIVGTVYLASNTVAPSHAGSAVVEQTAPASATPTASATVSTDVSVPGSAQ